MFVCFNVFVLDNHVCLFPTGRCIRVCKKVAGGASWRNIFNIDWDCQSCIDQLPRCFFIYKLAAIGHTCPPPFGSGKRWTGWKYHLFYYSPSDRLVVLPTFLLFGIFLKTKCSSCLHGSRFVIWPDRMMLCLLIKVLEKEKWDKLWWGRTSLGNILPKGLRFGNKAPAL